jgi:hypothetical protein
MIIANIKPEETHELTFDIDISGSKAEPSDIRFVIESQVDPKTGESVQDSFSIICRAVRTDDSIKVYIPRLLNLFRGGTYRAKLEVVLENRLFIPLQEDIVIEEPITVSVPMKKVAEQVAPEKPEITVTLSSVIKAMLDAPKPEPIIEDVEEPKIIEKPIPVDTSWREKGFTGIRNPFKK